jgi:hypothetical protein
MVMGMGLLGIMVQSLLETFVDQIVPGMVVASLFSKLMFREPMCAA